ncbi:glutamate-cysteine ligase family protein [Pontibacter sp. BT731]|uniref:carboxylate-amine ligase n=1 Tax=Pontibacter coccineus TaxID=3063328 RepID=UPI0026E4509F|nr:glutamate-cysteine ligase family protein [Pontibacter sp. BT731]MDO6391490.1 glutamate-cysteine ligase family protein [Pontibacter sp. BT731]
MSTKPATLHLFEGYGVEMEYMIVDRDILQVRPITDQLIYDEVGAYVSDVEFGKMAWSNELVLHVVELKTQAPAHTLEGLESDFQEHVRKINQLLEKHNAMLLPTGAHPLMDPFQETKLWPHEHNAVYEAYNRIFDCRGHGWANLQSTHLNLPFGNDEEFGKLHAAIRMVLPLIPALAASSPVLDGKVSGLLDTRLEVYRQNQSKIPAIAGKVVPEAVFTQKDYQEQILNRMYAAVAPHDPEGVLQEEFLNSRGAIARFDRSAIEIRIIDIQESPVADLAVLQAVVAAIQALVGERWVGIDKLKQWDENRLSDLFLQVVRSGQEVVISDREFIDCFGFDCKDNCTVGELWKHIVSETLNLEEQPHVAYALNVILSRGCLSKRIVEALGEHPGEQDIRRVYLSLARCLQQGSVFIPEKPC